MLLSDRSNGYEIVFIRTNNTVVVVVDDSSPVPYQLETLHLDTETIRMPDGKEAEPTHKSVTIRSLNVPELSVSNARRDGPSAGVTLFVKGTMDQTSTLVCFVPPQSSDPYEEGEQEVVNDYARRFVATMIAILSNKGIVCREGDMGEYIQKYVGHDRTFGVLSSSIVLN